MKRFKFNEKHMKSNLKKASAIVASVFMGLSAVSAGLSTASAEDASEAETPSLTENVASNESTTITDGKTTYTAIEETQDTQETSEAEQAPETTQPSENVQNTGSDKVRLVYEGKKKNVDDNEVSAQYGIMYVLEYDSQEAANEAENRLKSKGSKIDTEQVLSIDDETATSDIVETEQIDTAINQANEKSAKDYSGQNVIALIDTGSDGTALDAVSFVDGEAVDNNGHATRMAKAIRKQDKDAKILALKALDNNGNGTTSSVVAAIQYAIDSHVSIINLSLSGLANENSSLITAKVKEAIKAGIIVVASAGNNSADASNYVPANITGVITAGACDEGGNVLAISNYGESVDWYVKANATSSAAATLSGVLSKNGKIKENKKTIFAPQSVKLSSEKTDTDNSNNNDFSADDSGGAGGGSGAGGAYTTGKVVWAIHDNDDDGFGKAYNAQGGYNLEAVKKVIRNNMSIKIGEECWSGYDFGTDDKISTALKNAITQCRNNYVATYGSESGFTPRIVAVGIAAAWYSKGQFWMYNGTAKWPVEADWTNAWNSTANGLKLSHNQQAYTCGTQFHNGSASLTQFATGQLAGNDNIRIIVLDQNQPTPATGNLTLVKSSSNPDATNNNDLYTLEGAEYKVYKDESCAGTSVGTLKVNADGTANTIKDLKLGTYYVKETVSPTGYEKNTTVYKAEVKPSTTVTVQVQDTPILGSIGLKKSSTLPGCTSGNPNYTFEGAKYGLYTDSTTQNQVGTFTVKADGTSNTIADLKFGTYYIKEIKAPSGYLLNNEVKEVNLSSTSYNITTAVFDTPANDPGIVKLRKLDINGKVSKATGNASLEGAQYTLKFYTIDSSSDSVALNAFTSTYHCLCGESFDSQAKLDAHILKMAKAGNAKEHNDGYVTKTTNANPDRTMVFQTDAKGYINMNMPSYLVSGEIYKNSEGDLTWPLGVVTLEETKAPEGYYLDKNTYVGRVYIDTNKAEGASFKWMNGNTPSDTVILSDQQIKVSEEVKTTKFSLTKTITDGEISESPVRENGAKFIAVLKTYWDATTGADNVEHVKNALAKAKEADAVHGNTGLEYDELTTDSNGEVTSKELAFGEYVVVQIATGTNGLNTYKLADPFYFHSSEDGDKASCYGMTENGTRIPASSDGTVHFAVNDIPFKSYIQIVKKDSKTGQVIQLNNTTFRIIMKDKDGNPVKNYSGKTTKTDENGYVYSRVGKKWYSKFTTNAQNRLSALDKVGDALDSEGRYEENTDAEKGSVTIPNKLPSGKYSLVEIKAPSGYLRNTKEVDFTISPQTVTGQDDEGNALLAVEVKDTEPIGKLNLTKKLEDANNIKHGKIQFKLTAKEDIINPASGEVLFRAGDPVDVDGNHANGVYVLGANNKLTIPNLKMGKYNIQEISTYENYVLNGKVYSFEFVQKDDATPLYTSELEIENKLIKIQTVAKSETKLHMQEANEKATLTDTVTYQGLLVGRKYKVTGTLVDKDTGNPVVDADGKTVTAESKEFTAKQSDGEIDVVFKLNASKLAGKHTVVFEKLLNMDCTEVQGGDEIAKHEDLSDKNQEIQFISIHTNLTSENGTHDQDSGKRVSIVDKVTYKGLETGKQYTLKGTLMNKKTGEAFTDADGKTITAYTKFTPDEESGSVNVTFEFNTKGLEGTDVVAFEKLYYSNTQIAHHENINDKEQTVHLIKIGTTALTGNTTHMDQASDTKDSTVTITDTVDYKNLETGKKYTLKGVLMNKETNEALEVDGEEVTAETTFTPAERNGSQEVYFIFNAKGLEGTTIVAFEELYKEEETGSGKDVKVAEHKDINDEAQTINLMNIHTTAQNPENWVDGMEKEPVKEPADTENKDESEDKAEDKTDKDKPIPYAEEADETEKPSETEDALADTPSGTKIADLKDRTIILNKKKYILRSMQQNFKVGDKEFDIDFSDFVYVTREDSNHYSKKLVIDDIDNKVLIEASSINEDSASSSLKPFNLNYFFDVERMDMPEFNYTAGKQFDAAKNITVIDKVQYVNLIPNKTYRLHATIMNRKSGQPVKVNGKTIEVDKVFTPETSDGYVDVAVSFDAETLADTDCVVFEKMYLKDGDADESDDEKDILIAVHEDIDDYSQSFYINKPEIKTVATVDGKKEITAGNITVVDKVLYEGLVPGEEYTVTGTLMNKATNTPLKVNGNNVTSSTKFTPTERSGYVEVPFKFDASSFGDTDAVAFETISHTSSYDKSEKEIVKHEDINDKEQTVHINKAPKTGIAGRPDDNTTPYIMGSVIVMCMAVLAICIRKKYELNN